MKKVVQKKPVTFLEGTRFLFLFKEGEMKSAISSLWVQINLTGHHYWTKTETASLETALSSLQESNPPEVLVVDFDHLEGAFPGTWSSLLEAMRGGEMRTKVIFISSVLRQEVIKEIAAAKPVAYLAKNYFTSVNFENAIQKAYYARRVTR